MSGMVSAAPSKAATHEVVTSPAKIIKGPLAVASMQMLGQRVADQNGAAAGAMARVAGALEELGEQPAFMDERLSDGQADLDGEGVAKRGQHGGEACVDLPNNAVGAVFASALGAGKMTSSSRSVTMCSMSRSTAGRAA